MVAATRVTFHLVLGLVFAITLPFVVRGSAMLNALVARAMLTSLTRLRVEVAGLATRAQTAQQRTAAAVSAEAIALRRLERDIHDGPQQRLVRLAVDLGRANTSSTPIQRQPKARSTKRWLRRGRPWTNCATSPAVSRRRSSPTAASRRRPRVWRPAPRSP